MRQFNRDQAIVNTMNQFKPQAVTLIIKRRISKSSKIWLMP